MTVPVDPPPAGPAEATWSIAQAARWLGVSPQLVRDWIASDMLPTLPGAGRAPRLDPAAVRRWLDEARPSPPERLNQRDEHACFGCGRLNPFGLQLEFVADGDGVRADLTPGRLREGWAGTIHGGILSTMLDEALAWSLFRHQIWAVTARLNVSFRRPAMVGQPLSIHGWLVRDRGRLIEVAGEIRSADGTVLSEATGLFVRVSGTERDRLARIYGVVPPTPLPPSPPGASASDPVSDRRSG